MSEVVSAPVAPAAPAPVVAPAPVQEMNPSDAARALAARRIELRKQTAEPAAPQEAAPEPPPELADEANADPQAEAPSETTEAPEPADLPPIEPPRSWTQAEKERFQSLPRETQEYLHTREQEREREFRRGQNEAAEQRKAYEAEQSKARELQQKYEAKLSQVMQTIQETGPFSDIRTMADLEKLQAEDPFRFQAYQLHQWKLQATQAELQEAESRRTQEKQSKRAAYEAEQNKLLTELVPEMADPSKANDLRTRAVNMLIDDLGLKNEQLSRWMLQVGHPGLEVTEAGFDGFVANLEPFMPNWRGTARIIAALDVVVSIDTSVAHLAGAMGKPVFTLVTTNSDWRWDRNSQKSIWYDSMRVIRQHKQDDWSKCIEEVKGRLKEMSGRIA